jgi:hypothetical protein
MPSLLCWVNVTRKGQSPPIVVKTSQCDEEGNALPVILSKCDKGGANPSPSLVETSQCDEEGNALWAPPCRGGNKPM